MMAVSTLKSWMIAGLVTSLVAGCEPKAGGGEITTEPLSEDAGGAADLTAAGETVASPAAAPARSVRLVDRDVEAPEDFQATDKALWDGRPSLGGVWVAADNVMDPMRVIMRNPANGKFVIGALFRRESDNPGPRLQISSDAAEALGLVAGEPATINVTALRREEVPATAPDATKPLLDSSEAVAPATDVAAVAAPAIAAVEEAPAAKPTAPAIRPLANPATNPEAAAATDATAPTIQVGIFSVENNAKRAVEALAKAGITATIRKEKTQGKSLWSVIATGDKALLACQDPEGRLLGRLLSVTP